MPKYLLLPLLFLLQLSARAQKAQEPSSRWSLGVTAGPSFPVGQSKGKLYLLLDTAYQGADGHEFAQNTVSCVHAGVGAGIHF